MGEDRVLINRNDLMAKFEEVLLLISSYLIRSTVDLKSFEWRFTLKYLFDEQSRSISIQVFLSFQQESKMIGMSFCSVWTVLFVMVMI
jgi:hypothetical protein